MKTLQDRQDNIDKNEWHYNQKYAKVNINGILKILSDVDGFLDAQTTTEISWVGMYSGDFKTQLKNKKILELGCGDAVNVAIMAALGAEVYANDIAASCGDIINALNAAYPFEYPITFIPGDFVSCEFLDNSMDFVIGKAFLHHLTESYEQEMLLKASQVLKIDGEARFFETAVNSKLLDELRWATPLKDRPSKYLQPTAFKNWVANDPHPARGNSTKYYQQLGEKYFHTTHIIPMGILERFDRLLPLKPVYSGKFKRWSLKIETHLPKSVRTVGARSQMIIYSHPKRNI